MSAVPKPAELTEIIFEPFTTQAVESLVFKR